jgi:hypothetical protein
MGEWGVDNRICVDRSFAGGINLGGERINTNGFFQTLAAWIYPDGYIHLFKNKNQKVVFGLNHKNQYA